MRQEYEDAIGRLGDNPYARKGFYNEINQIAPSHIAAYSTASPAERKTMLKQAQKSARELWDRDWWPEALGVSIVYLNAESRFVPGNDAAYVRAETDRLIKEAEQFFEAVDKSYREAVAEMQCRHPEGQKGNWDLNALEKALEAERKRWPE
jgi:hypothetical protein